jgi:hypothetical protein
VTSVATSSSGLPVNYTLVSGPATLSGTTLVSTATGKVVVRASQAGNAEYQPAVNVERSFTVQPRCQTINFATITNQLLSNPPILLSATASSGLPVAFSLVSGPAMLTGNILTLTNAGSVSISANQSGNSLYSTAPTVTQSFSVAKHPQTINFQQPTNQVWGDPPISLTATSDSGLPITFSVVSGPAIITGNLCVPTNYGTITISAQQVGNNTWLAASTNRTLTVSRWATCNSGTNGDILSVVCGTNRWLAFGDGFALASTNGLTWTPAASPCTGKVKPVYINGTFVVNLYTNYAGSIYASTDGLIWSLRNNNNAYGSHGFTCDGHSCYAGGFSGGGDQYGFGGEVFYAFSTNGWDWVDCSWSVGRVVANSGAWSGYLYAAAPLPSGFNFDTTSGVISGVPTINGTNQITLTAANSAGAGSAVLSLIVGKAAIPTRLYAIDVTADQRFRFTVTSEAGLSLKLWTSTDLTNWSLLNTFTNTTGTMPLEHTISNQNQRFYRVEAVQ